MALYLTKYYAHGLAVVAKLTQKITSANKVKMITSFISEMAEVRQGCSTSEGAASKMSNKAIIDFLLESDSDLSSLNEKSSDEEDENDICIDSETEDEIIFEEHEDIIFDNIDEETSEAADASHQTVEKDTRKRTPNTSKAGQSKRKNPKKSMKESNGKMNHQSIG